MHNYFTELIILFNYEWAWSLGVGYVIMSNRS